MRRSVCGILIAFLWGATAWGDPPSAPPQTATAAGAVAPPRKSVKSTPAGRPPDTQDDGVWRPVPSGPLAEGAAASPEETAGSEERGGEPAEASAAQAHGIVLDFRTRELMELKRIARELGGDLVISIEPRGISPADLIVPLKSSGLFEVSAKDGRIFLITSNGEGQKHELEREIAALARRQAALLRNIEVLEALRAEGKVVDPREGQEPGNARGIAAEGSPPAAPPNADNSDYPLPVK
ncbi:exported protein of unknown function [Methylacidimicrobium sp. AP8]|uniref:hypothetical protein n=1 Tax=Methylacidimicrobium sp. AP8 TaxID=2730359 RepID=UPI0018BFD1B0|nr:hypothetical protein [Methylacidimicrobium sp. AP8]CAB4243562.1 exported protein of unknown function [Methylacidimicrobium sp. AP8]